MELCDCLLDFNACPLIGFPRVIAVDYIFDTPEEMLPEPLTRGLTRQRQELEGALGREGFGAELRETLECKAAELAAERSESRHLDRLKQALRDMEESREDYRRFLQSDVEFHITLAEATSNRIFSEMLRFLLEKVVGHHETFKTALITSEYRSHSIRTLKQVLACINREDGRGAAEWMREHLNAIRRELKDIF